MMLSEIGQAVFDKACKNPLIFKAPPACHTNPWSIDCSVLEASLSRNRELVDILIEHKESLSDVWAS